MDAPPRLVLFATIAAGGACGSGLSFLPAYDGPTNARDPNPMASIVPARPPSEPTAPDRTSPSGPAEDRDRVLVSAASAIAWLVAGVTPLVGWFGTFDENQMFEEPEISARRPAAGPAPSSPRRPRTVRPAPGSAPRP